MDQDQGSGRRPSRPTYIHELNDWPDFRWNEEVIEQPLELVGRLQKQIVADASNMGRAAALKTTVRNLTNSAVASSRIEEEYPDPNAVKAAIRRSIVFEAPAAERLDAEMTAFLDWFNQPEAEPDLRKPAIAHLWFVTIHPYDDGNGRIARAITDLALSRCDGTDTRLYSMSAAILRQRSRYYRALQVTQSDSMNITSWMLCFLDCLTDAMIQG